ncbi:Pycsar system effector family protein [Streptomyces maremycinicus]|uniref:Pycsar system effector family protein n=1 Tax=Streptomyces maremycinicus TaxID=1679753 RepID=UPI0007887F80|nr:Pycsar system effector family protein [Streptomyces sp. NBRC 110468]
MPDTGENSRADEQVNCTRLEGEAAGMFTELQRADTKATALCGLIGGLLAVDAMALSAVSESPRMPVAALVGAAVLLGVALMMTMVAIRPALPPGGRLRAFVCSVAHSGPPETAERNPAALEADRHLLLQAERLALFTTLAQRKFRILRWAVDVTAAALTMAGTGLLILYITI